jgi:hypothetical protein
MDFRAFLVTTAAAACLAFGFANAADAQNLPPLAGPVIDQITGQPVIGTYTTRTVDFTATNAITIFLSPSARIRRISGWTMFRWSI